MPLIICNKCGCIENTHLSNKFEPYVPTIYNYDGDEDKFFPHMSRMEMDGHDTEDIIVNGRVWKRKDETMYLCSSCNVGVWHNEFPKTFPSEKTKILSLFSKGGFITPFDQDDISYIRDDDNEECGYSPNLQYYYILKLYRKMIGDNNFRGPILEDLKRRSNAIKPSTETYPEFLKYGNFLLFFDMMKEEKENFHVYLQGDGDDIEDWSDTREIAIRLLDSVIDESKAKGLWQTLYRYHNMENDDGFRNKIFEYKTFKKPSSSRITNMGNDIYNNAMSLVNQFGIQHFKEKAHWKDIQPQEEKERKLRLAEEKRQRKKNRR